MMNKFQKDYFILNYIMISIILKII